MKRYLILLILIISVIAGAAFFYNKRGSSATGEIKSPLAKSNRESVFKKQLEDKFDFDSENKEIPETDLATKEIINILLLGIDRRSKDEFGYRTDIMILLSVNKTDNKVLMTSVPRDLWYDGGRINATYIQSGWEGIQQAFGDITGQTPERFILTDFEDFAWIVDQMGGVPVTVETTFTDSQYPIDATKEYQTISFTAGPEVLTGERALIYSRSRKGDNDNGDWGRMRRQHNILKGMLVASTQPQSFLCKLSNNTQQSTSCESSVDKETLKEALEIVTSGRMDTNLKLADLEYLWDFYKEKDNYEIESLFMDYDYVYTPPASEYGGAWVLAPIGDSYSNFQEIVKNKIYGIEEVYAENETNETTQNYAQ